MVPVRSVVPVPMASRSRAEDDRLKAGDEACRSAAFVSDGPMVAVSVEERSSSALAEPPSSCWESVDSCSFCSLIFAISYGDVANTRFWENHYCWKEARGILILGSEKVQNGWNNGNRLDG